jgi:hypothetical protein
MRLIYLSMASAQRLQPNFDRLISKNRQRHGSAAERRPCVTPLCVGGAPSDKTRATKPRLEKPKREMSAKLQ